MISIKRHDRSKSVIESYIGRNRLDDGYKTVNITNNTRDAYKLNSDDVCLLTFAEDEKITKMIRVDRLALRKKENHYNSNHPICLRIPKNDKENIKPYKQFQTKKIPTAHKLINWKNTKEEKINKKRLEVLANDLKNCTFKPKIDENSKRITNKLNYPGINKLVNECKPAAKNISIHIDFEKTIDILEESAKIYLNRTKGMNITENEKKILNELIYKKFN
jgi:hypothetical protein